MSYEVWGEPPEYSDPLDSVENPRERKPWKRNRHAVHSAMQKAINARCWANPMVVDAYGTPGLLSKDHSLRFVRLNHLHFEIGRYRWESKGKRRSWRLDALARLHRGFDLIPYFDKPPLPCDSDRLPKGGDDPSSAPCEASQSGDGLGNAEGSASPNPYSPSPDRGGER